MGIAAAIASSAAAGSKVATRLLLSVRGNGKLVLLRLFLRVALDDKDLLLVEMHVAAVCTMALAGEEICAVSDVALSLQHKLEKLRLCGLASFNVDVLAAGMCAVATLKVFADECLERHGRCWHG